MTIIKGYVIKEERIKRSMKQEELADGICKQATISNLENKNFCQNIEILVKICSKLNLSIDEVIEPSPEMAVKAKIKKIKKYCEIQDNESAKKIIHTIDESSISEGNLLKQYYYYMGIISLLADSDTSSAIFYFNQSSEDGNDEDLYSILSFMALGMVYERANKGEISKRYYDKAVSLASNSKMQELELNKVYFNAAKFYSERKEYEYAISLCNEGIRINKMYTSMNLLDLLYYEKAFNAMMIKRKDFLDLYFLSYNFSLLVGNEHVASTIKSDLGDNFDSLFRTI